jgi:hypothetical protein
MYAHPSFIRGHPEALFQLQKTTAKHKQQQLPVDFKPVSTTSQVPLRSVSPSCSHTIEDVSEKALVLQKANNVKQEDRIQMSLDVESLHHFAPVSPIHSQRCVTLTSIDSDASSTGSNDRGKLDLLAFALEQEIACYNNIR